MTEPNSRRPIGLAKLATIFSVVFGITFGLCAVDALTGGFGHQWVAPYVISVSLVVEGVCLLGLLGVGLAAIVRAFRRNPQD
jgi:hypothetical protein